MTRNIEEEGATAGIALLRRGRLDSDTDGLTELRIDDGQVPHLERW